MTYKFNKNLFFLIHEIWYRHVYYFIKLYNDVIYFINSNHKEFILLEVP